MNPLPRSFAAGFAGLAVTYVANLALIAWLRGSTIDGDAFYDGLAGGLTQIVPALIGGLVLGAIAKDSAANTAAAAFALWCVAGFVHPFWQIPQVSPQSIHSRGLHYILYIPFVTLAFGWLGAWLAGQFATGRFTLADKEPPAMLGMED